MDEMQLLRELGDATPLATATELAPARTRFVAATTRRPKRRVAVYGAAVIGLAAAIFAVFALIPPGKSGTGGPLAPPVASAEEVLAKAAQAALRVPDINPRPNQLIYRKTQWGSGGLREEWLSVDGVHDGLIQQEGRDFFRLPGCRDGKKQMLDKADKPLPGRFEDCTPSPAYLPDLPTDGDAMLAYLKKNQSGEKGDLNALSKDILGLLMSNYLRPAARAALFQAVAKIDGLTVREGVKDGAGRTGVQISWDIPERNHGGSFVVDPMTYAYLGSTTEAQLVVAVVDTVGQRP